ncbi:MAG TPA: tetratricopeptide repeat protein [Vicinamibacterales bacterium]|nr:tetratricopeptide repeat protein [Vicinamibacterales bacterium]
MRVRWACAVFCLLVTGVGPARAQSALELNQAGWKSLEQGDPVRAGQLFADALAQRPNEPVLLFGAAVSAQLQGRPTEAKPRLERALEVNPRFTPASLLLGEIVYREGDLDRAIKTYETALTHAPGNPELTGRLTKWREEASVHNGFVERRQDRFRVLFEGRTDAPLAAQTTDTLNTAFWRIGQALGAYPTDQIHVVLYTEKQFRDITRAPEWSGGLYDGKIRVPVAGATRSRKLFETVLSHELTHAMVASLASRGVPAWLHEGLAQHFDGSSVAAARRRLAAHRVRIPLEQLERGFNGLTTAGAVIAYDESLVAASAILARRDISWTQLLYALADSDRPSETLRGYGIVYADLEASFAK